MSRNAENGLLIFVCNIYEIFVMQKCYLVCSSASERATDTLDKKIKKLIRKDMELNPANARK